MASTAEDGWAPGPLRPRLAPGAVHVWRADLMALSEDLCELLCEEERERAERILHERDRELWRHARGLLRALLARYLQREPRALRFSTGAHGKPALLEDARASSQIPPPAHAGESPLPFNMSHSGQVALYAISDAGAVGVDVEVARRPLNALAIATRMLGPAEAQRLRALAPAAREREFLRAWARHEAELKCLGVGIGAAAAERSQQRPWVAQLQMGRDAAGAVAAERPVRELRCWCWRA